MYIMKAAGLHVSTLLSHLLALVVLIHTKNALCIAGITNARNNSSELQSSIV